MRRAEHGHTTAATAALHCPLGVSMSTGAGGWGTAAAAKRLREGMKGGRASARPDS
ncbi:hypothetical protein EMIHUDRAFT_366853 [Emiliania huxleyi CCMP1516]|uniref:Uncharacterized protein n=2 Tax=Emiliania huxleyi TaxID=2903 RepID=A0A0D3JTL8_EMIH1|nr:hypothetical protein EMIHUDRAFT_366853 [Emiliania huxleyi CCMP1516]EOD26853.1 hypothetical protein EMIHUDRAFT_366853 [Emiliania huxleyi CCMP1516]|eukprot:XP_005779282.1 hypothetical protein EMIHUDRAFT_366853 [Emiliania huxleyi CCMP1516]